MDEKIEMVYKTEIEWLRARWMQEHACARYPDSAFARFAAPDLTAEEIRDCDFDDLATLIEFVRPTEVGRDSTETHTERRLEPPASSTAPPDYVNIRIYREDRDRLANDMKYGETMADAIHALIEPARGE